MQNKTYFNNDTMWFGIYHKEINDFIYPFWFRSNTEAQKFINDVISAEIEHIIQNHGGIPDDITLNKFAQDTDILDDYIDWAQQFQVRGGKYSEMKTDMQQSGYQLITQPSHDKRILNYIAKIKDGTFVQEPTD